MLFATIHTMAMRILLLLCLLSLHRVEAAFKKVRITDDLDDVVDDEEDEGWKAWGKPKPKPRALDPPPDFVDGMDLLEYQSEIIKRTEGPSIGFVKLRLDELRDPDEIPLIAKKWTALLKSGTIDATIVAVDRTTIMFTIPKGEDITEVKDFVLNQPEAYEFKLGQNTFRRPGDPPLEVVVEKLKKQRESVGKTKDFNDEL